MPTSSNIDSPSWCNPEPDRDQLLLVIKSWMPKVDRMIWMLLKRRKNSSLLPSTRNPSRSSKGHHRPLLLTLDQSSKVPLRTKDQSILATNVAALIQLLTLREARCLLIRGSSSSNRAKKCRGCKDLNRLLETMPNYRKFLMTPNIKNSFWPPQTMPFTTISKLMPWNLR